MTRVQLDPCTQLMVQVCVRHLSMIVIVIITAISITTTTSTTATTTIIIIPQGFAHHASAVLKRFASRDSNMPAVAAAHVMLTMRVLACECW